MDILYDDIFGISPPDESDTDSHPCTCTDPPCERCLELGRRCWKCRLRLKAFRQEASLAKSGLELACCRRPDDGNQESNHPSNPPDEFIPDLPGPAERTQPRTHHRRETNLRENPVGWRSHQARYSDYHQWSDVWEDREEEYFFAGAISSDNQGFVQCRSSDEIYWTYRKTETRSHRNLNRRATRRRKTREYPPPRLRIAHLGATWNDVRYMKEVWLRRLGRLRLKPQAVLSVKGFAGSMLSDVYYRQNIRKMLSLGDLLKICFLKIPLEWISRWIPRLVERFRALIAESPLD